MQLIWKMLSKEKGATASSKKQYRKWIFIWDRDCFQFLQEYNLLLVSYRGELHLFFCEALLCKIQAEESQPRMQRKSLPYLFHLLKLTLNLAFAQVIYLWGVKLKMLFFLIITSVFLPVL